MKKYIIKYNSKVNGINIKLYHESININTHKDTMNVYVESLTTDKKLAKVFYDKEEAIKVSNLFACEYQIPIIINH
jgi:hypothetical protein